MICKDSLVLSLLFKASFLPLSCLIFDHLLWPDARTEELVKYLH